MSSTRATLPMSTTTVIRTTTTHPTLMGFVRILEAHIRPVLGSASPKGKIIPAEKLNDSAKAEPPCAGLPYVAIYEKSISGA